MFRRASRGLVGVMALLIIAVMLFPLFITSTSAQSGRPAAFDEALKDLSKRVGRTLTLTDFDNPTSRWEWRGVNFADNTLECPMGTEVPVAGTVVGYQFIFVLRGTTYDYRVAYNDVKTLRLCTNSNAGQKYTLPTLTPAATGGTDAPASFNAALADLGKRLNLNLTLTDFDSPRSSWRWRYVVFANSQLECPSAGQTTDQVLTPGYIYTFVYERITYEYRVAVRQADKLLLCKGSGKTPAPSPTPRPGSTARPSATITPTPKS